MKQSLRKQIRTLKHTFSAEQLNAFSGDVCSRLLKEARLLDAQTILAFYPLPDEVNIIEVIDTLAAKGKLVLLPEVISDTEMILREYHGPSDLKEGAFGILEPTGKEYKDYSLIDIALIPGMAFDAQGNRLGRGKGYYDRFFAKLLKESSILPHLIGVCYPFQIVEEVPTDEYDYSVDKVIY